MFVEMSLEKLAKNMIDRIEEQNRELQNLIDYILYPHSIDEVINYANNLKHRLEEK